MQAINLISIDDSTVECPECGAIHTIKNIIRANFGRSTITFVCANKCQEKLIISIKNNDSSRKLSKSKICSLVLDVENDYFSSPLQDVESALSVVEMMECQNMFYLLADR